MSKSRCNKLLFAHHVRKFVGEFPDFKYDGSRMVCLVCNKDLLCWNRTLCRRHLNSETHKYRKSGRNSYAEFRFHLIFTLGACNMSFNVMEKQEFRNFWKKYSPTWKLPSRTSLRKYLPNVRDRIENNIKSQIHDKKLWLTVDVTVDSKKHSIASVIVRTMDPLRPSPPYLIASKRLEKCTGEAIQDLVLTTLQKFQLSTQQVLMFVSEGLSSMLLGGGNLKNVCPNLIHVTCMLHALHLVVETIRICYPDVDALIAQTKAVFFKSPKHSREFRKHCPGIREPPQSILTRWGTWLKAAFYYFRYFQKIKFLVSQFDAEESPAIEESQMKFQDAQVEADLRTIHDNYVTVADAIQKLQNASLSLAESLQIVDDVETVLQTLNDQGSIRVRQKFNSALKTNPDFARLREICNDSPTDSLSNFRTHFKYANITSIDAGHSLYKNIFLPQRTSFTETTVETYAMLQMFGQAHPDL